MELEHHDVAERMIGSFSVFLPCNSVANNFFASCKEIKGAEHRGQKHESQIFSSVISVASVAKPLSD